MWGKPKICLWDIMVTTNISINLHIPVMWRLPSQFVFVSGDCSGSTETYSTEINFNHWWWTNSWNFKYEAIIKQMFNHFIDNNQVALNCLNSKWLRSFPIDGLLSRHGLHFSVCIHIQWTNSRPLLILFIFYSNVQYFQVPTSSWYDKQWAYAKNLT